MSITKPCPSCNRDILINNQYCTECSWFADETARVEYEQAKKTNLEQLKAASAKTSIEGISTNTALLHVIGSKIPETMDKDYHEFVETEIFQQKFIRIFFVKLVKKNKDRIIWICAFKKKSEDSIFYSQMSISSDSDGLIIDFPYHVLGKYLKETIVIIKDIEYLAGHSSFLLNEMQYNYSGRLLLYGLYKEGGIKKPKNVLY